MRPGWAHVEMCGRRGRHWLHGLDGLHLVLHGIRGSLRLGVLCLAEGGGVSRFSGPELILTSFRGIPEKWLLYMCTCLSPLPAPHVHMHSW